MHSLNPTCFACHGVMDPLGFALENFDAVGQYREMDRTTRNILDTSGKLPDGTSVKGLDDLRNALLAKPEQFVQTLTHKLHDLRPRSPRRVPRHADGARHRAQAAADNYRFSSAHHADRDERCVPQDRARRKVRGCEEVCHCDKRQECKNHVHHAQTYFPPHGAQRAPVPPSRCRCWMR